MISIAEAISDLLFVRDTVVVPGLGAFVKKPVSAQVNPVANYFGMPSSEIVFDANLREDNDLVVNYIAEKNEVPEDEARRLLAMFVSDCFNSLKQGKKVVLNNIGTLKNDWDGNLVFEQDKAMNYNADAFGLCDFTPEPVLRSKTKDEIKAEIAQQQKDKNTPVTVDEKAVHEHDRKVDDDDHGRHWGWLWVLLALLLLAGVGYGLHYFKVVDFSQWFGKGQPAEFEPWKVVLPEAKTWETEKVPVELESDTLVEEQQPIEVEQEPEQVLEQEPVQEVEQNPEQEPVQEPEQQPEPVVVNPEANIRIIAGCFAQEENAARLSNTLKEKGFTGAFYEMRGTKWFISFGRYNTDEEATAALREIRKNTEYKAWILK